ncbi:MAG: acyltransferase [Bacteroides sp.]|nr:acyltransferase [Bacteroides sp.]
MDKGRERQWDGKSRGGSFGYFFFIFVIKNLGIRFAYTILAAVVFYFLFFAPKALRAVWDYNRRRLGYGRCRSVLESYRHFYVFGQTLIDRVAIRAGLQHRYRFEFENYDRFIEVIDRSGVVMMGAHVGCWDAGSVFFGDYGHKINIVMFDAEHERIKKMLAKSGMRCDYKIIPINKGSVEAMVQIKVALNNGEYVCFNADRHVDAASSFPIRLLNGTVRFPEGPFRIVSRCRMPVFFYYAMREKKRTYRFIFTEIPSEDVKDEKKLGKRYAASLEEIVRQYPRQWFNFYRFWQAEAS